MTNIETEDGRCERLLMSEDRVIQNLWAMRQVLYCIDKVYWTRKVDGRHFDGGFAFAVTGNSIALNRET